MKSYLSQNASPWVSFAVMAGGLFSALILAFLYRAEERAQNFYHYREEGNITLYDSI